MAGHEKDESNERGRLAIRPLPEPPAFDSITMQRVTGALLGSAVGDALGAPFEFRQAGLWSETFPEPVMGGTGEMIGGGSFNWKPGEFTDDTQMTIAIAQSLIEHGAYVPADVFERFVAWRRSAKDYGMLTGRVLLESDWADAARLAHIASNGRSAANGSLMRVTAIAIAWSGADEATLIDAARAQSALTHFDAAAGWGAAIAAAMIQRAIHGDDPIAAIDEILERVDVDERSRFSVMLDASWTPNQPDDPSNGSVWTCLAQAVWAVRHNATFADVMSAAIDLGGDTDTVATVAGAIAGARASVQGIPSRWLTYLNGTVGTPDGVASFDNASLQDLSRALVGLDAFVPTAQEAPAGPSPVAPGLFAANLGGAATASTDQAVVSLCRTLGLFDAHPIRREVHLIDRSGPANADASAAVRDAVDSIDAFLAEGREVVVHCHGGHSRTGVVLKAWAMRTHGFSEREAHDWLAAAWSEYRDWEPAFIELLEREWS